VQFTVELPGSPAAFERFLSTAFELGYDNALTVHRLEGKKYQTSIRNLDLASAMGFKAQFSRLLGYFDRRATLVTEIASVRDNPIDVTVGGQVGVEGEQYKAKSQVIHVLDSGQRQLVLNPAASTLTRLVLAEGGGTRRRLLSGGRESIVILVHVRCRYSTTMSGSLEFLGRTNRTGEGFRFVLRTAVSTLGLDMSSFIATPPLEVISFDEVEGSNNTEFAILTVIPNIEQLGSALGTLLVELVKVNGAGYSAVDNRTNLAPVIFSSTWNQNAPIPYVNSREVNDSSVVSTPFFEVTVSFDQPVTNFNPQQLRVLNARIDQEASASESFGSAFKLIVWPIENGNVTILAPSNSYWSRFGVWNIASNLFTVVYKLESLDIQISVDTISPSNSTELVFSLEFSESVSVINASAVFVNNGFLRSVLRPELESAILVVEPVETGTVYIELAKQTLFGVSGVSNTLDYKSPEIFFDPCLTCGERAVCTPNGTIALCACRYSDIGDPYSACLLCPGVFGSVCSGRGACVLTSDGVAACDCNVGFSGATCSENEFLPEPSKARVKVVDFSSVLLSWDAATDSQVTVDFIDGYRIRYGNEIIELPLNQTERLLTGLIEGERYDVFLTLKSPFGEGKRASLPVLLRPLITKIICCIGPATGSTRGGDRLLIQGEHLMLPTPNVTNNITVVYGPRLETVYDAKFSCTVDESTVTPTELECIVGPGVGSELRFILVNEGVASDAFTSFEYVYAAPRIADSQLTLSGYDGGTGSVIGVLGKDDILQLKGSNFGDSVEDVSVSFRDELSSSECVTTYVDHELLRCKMKAGTGFHLYVTVMASGSTVRSRSNTYSYPAAPIVNSFSGCKGGCPTEGGLRITVNGNHFGNVNGLVNVRVAGRPCTDVDVLSRKQLSCKLPSGVGKSLGIAVSVSLLRTSIGILSYGSPEVFSITGCEYTNAKGAAFGCSRTMSPRITISGINFGAANAIVRIGNDKSCTEIVHSELEPHSSVSCLLPRGRNKQSVFLSQRGGSFSAKRFGTVEYQPCPPGTRFGANFTCVDCEPGKFSSTNDALKCEDCTPGSATNQSGTAKCQLCLPQTYQPDRGALECLPCVNGTIQPNYGLSKCIKCENNFYSHRGKCLVCPQGAQCLDGDIESLANFFLIENVQTLEMVTVRCQPRFCLAGECAPNRKNLLCGQCTDGYYLAGSNCSPCAYTHGIFLFGLVLANYAVVFMVYKGAENLKPPHEGLLKIFLFAVQSLSLMFPVEELKDEISSLAQFFNFKMMSGGIESSEGSSNTFCYQFSPFLTLYISLLQPIISFAQLYLQALVMYGLHVYRNKSFKGFSTSAYRRASINLFSTSYYAGLAGALATLDCVSVNEKRLLRINPSVDCFSSEYKEIQYIATVVVILIFSVQLQMIAVMFRNYRRGYLAPELLAKCDDWLALKQALTLASGEISKARKQEQEERYMQEAAERAKRGESLVGSKKRMKKEKKAAKAAEKEALKNEKAQAEQARMAWVDSKQRGRSVSRFRSMFMRSKSKGASEGKKIVEVNESDMTPEELLRYQQKERRKKHAEFHLLPWNPRGLILFRYALDAVRQQGTLMATYTHSVFYWEFVSMLRRASFILVAMTYESGRNKKAAFAILCCAQLILHCAFQPYDRGDEYRDPKLRAVLSRTNTIEFISLGGLYLLSNLSLIKFNQKIVLLQLKFSLMLITVTCLAVPLGIVIVRDTLFRKQYSYTRAELEDRLGDEELLTVRRLPRTKPPPVFNAAQMAELGDHFQFYAEHKINKVPIRRLKYLLRGLGVKCPTKIHAQRMAGAGVKYLTFGDVVGVVQKYMAGVEGRLTIRDLGFAYYQEKKLARLEARQHQLLGLEVSRSKAELPVMLAAEKLFNTNLTANIKVLSQEKLEEYTDLFHMYTVQDGHVTKDDVIECVHRIGKIVDRLDRDFIDKCILWNKGDFYLEHFLAVVCFHLSVRRHPDLLACYGLLKFGHVHNLHTDSARMLFLEAFAEIDTDGNNFICVEELDDMFEYLRYFAVEGEVARLVAAGGHKDRLKFDAFWKLVSSRVDEVRKGLTDFGEDFAVELSDSSYSSSSVHDVVTDDDINILDPETLVQHQALPAINLDFRAFQMPEEDNEDSGKSMTGVHEGGNDGVGETDEESRFSLAYPQTSDNDESAIMPSRLAAGLAGEYELSLADVPDFGNRFELSVHTRNGYMSDGMSDGYSDEDDIMPFPEEEPVPPKDSDTYEVFINHNAKESVYNQLWEASISRHSTEEPSIVRAAAPAYIRGYQEHSWSQRSQSSQRSRSNFSGTPRHKLYRGEESTSTRYSQYASTFGHLASRNSRGNSKSFQGIIFDLNDLSQVERSELSNLDSDLDQRNR